MRAWFPALAVLIGVASPALAHASYVADEVGVGATQPSPSDPRSGSLSESIYGLWDPSRTVSLTARLMLTHDDAVPPFAGAQFGEGGGNIILLSVGAEWDATPHLNIGGMLSVSPSSTQFSDSPLDLTLATGTYPVDSLVQTQASSLGALISFIYDTAELDPEEPSRLDWAFGLNLGATDFDAQQSISKLSFFDKALDRDRDLSMNALEDSYCVKNPKRPVCTLAGSLGGQKTSITQFPIEADATATLFEDTDLGLAFTWFGYSSDPTDAGFFTVAAAGRSEHTGGGLEFGTGLPLAPESYVVRPDLGRVFGPLYVDLFAEYGNYLDDQGHEIALGLKASWKLGRHWKLAAKAIFSRETPGPGLIAEADPGTGADQPVISTAFTLGLRYTF